MVTIELSNSFVDNVSITANTTKRLLAMQIEYWAKLGKLAEENPDLPMDFMKDILVSLQQTEIGEVSEYKFG